MVAVILILLVIAVFIRFIVKNFAAIATVTVLVLAGSFLWWLGSLVVGLF